MKGEGVEPGDVVYTAALAECRWAGQAQHVDYLLQQMEAKGMTIVPGLMPEFFESHPQCWGNLLGISVPIFCGKKGAIFATRTGS